MLEGIARAEAQGFALLKELGASELKYVRPLSSSQPINATVLLIQLDLRIVQIGLLAISMRIRKHTSLSYY
eukprot:scaffold102629_cov17-Prasinocladus_malaysianus.AAC.1